MKIEVDIKKLYKVLCPKCKKRLEEIVEKDIAKAATKQVLEGQKE